MHCFSIFDSLGCFFFFGMHFIALIMTLSCRKIGNRICVVGSDPAVVESPTEPKWSPKGTLLNYLIKESIQI